MLWLTVKTGLNRRNASSALALLVVVALGTASCLAALGTISAVDTRADRDSWTDPSTAQYVGLSSEPLPGVTYTNFSQDYFNGYPVIVISVAPSDDNAPTPPGLADFPAPGEAFLSPALADLASNSAPLSARYGGISGLVGMAGVSNPAELLAVRGVELDEAMLSGSPVSAYGSTALPPDVTSPARLLPILLFLTILTVTLALLLLAVKVGGSQRRDTLGRLRLLGASVKQIRMFAMVQKIVPLAVGISLGLVGFQLIRPILAGVQIGDGTFYEADVRPGLVSYLMTVGFIALVGLLATQANVTEMVTGGVVRMRGVERKLRARLRIVFVAIVAVGAILGSSYITGSDLGRTSTALLLVVAVSIVLLLVTPLFVSWIGGVFRLGRGPAALLAGRRLAGNPRSLTRATSGISIAVIISVIYAAVAPGAYAEISDEQVIAQREDTVQISVGDATREQDDDLTSWLTELNGVKSVAQVGEATISAGSGSYTVWIGECTSIVESARLNDVPCGQAGTIVASNILRAGFDPTTPFEMYNFRPADQVGSNNELLFGESGALTIQLNSGVAEMPANTAVDSPDIIIDSVTLDPSVAEQIRPSVVLARIAPSADLEILRTGSFERIPNVQISTRETSYNGFNLQVRTVRDLVSVLAVSVSLLAGVSLVVALNASLVERRQSILALMDAGARKRIIFQSLTLESIVPVLVSGLSAVILSVGGAYLVGLDDLPLWTLTGQASVVLLLGILSSSIVFLFANRMVSDRRRRG